MASEISSAKVGVILVIKIKIMIKIKNKIFIDNFGCFQIINFVKQFISNVKKEKILERFK